MDLKLTKALAVVAFLFFGMPFLWYFVTSGNVKDISVKTCRKSVAPGLKALTNLVEHSWLQRDYYDVNVYHNGPCLFYRFYQNPGILYYGQERDSGYIIGVAMSTEELNEFADTISPDTDTQKMLHYLSERAKKNPAPDHEF